MKKLTSRKKLALYGFSGLGVNMLTLVVGSYLCSALLVGGFEEHIESWTYLNKNLVIAGIWSVIVFFAKALDGIIDLPIAFFIERLNPKMGRRKAGLLIGLIPMLIAFVLFLIPLNDSATLANTIWFGVLLCIFYTFYTLTMLTYYATFPEVCETEKDTVFLSNMKSISDVVYFSLSYALIPVFISFGVNIRIVALIFLPLVLTMLIPFFLLKENNEVVEESKEVKNKPITLKDAFNCSFKNKSFIYWMLTASVMTIGLQLFLGGINELFSSTGLNMTFVMASAFAPVPLTIIVYNKIVKHKGLGFAYRYILTVFTIGMIVMYFCNINSHNMTELQLTLVAIIGGIFVSFAIGAFFSVTYTVPTHLAAIEEEKSGKKVASMYFAVQGVFEGIAAGIATGLILVTLKDKNVISLLPLIVAGTCAIAFIMSFAFKKDISLMGKNNKQVESK